MTADAPGSAPEPAMDPESAPEPGPEPGERSPLRDAMIALEAGIAVVVVVLLAAALTGALPEPLRAFVTGTPLAIVVLLLGTAWVLWRISRPGAPRP